MYLENHGNSQSKDSDFGLNLSQIKLYLISHDITIEQADAIIFDIRKEVLIEFINILKVELDFLDADDYTSAGANINKILVSYGVDI